MNLSLKFEIAERFLKDRHPRFANDGSARVLADSIDTTGLRMNAEYIPTDKLEGAFESVKSILADNYATAINGFFARHQEWHCHKGSKGLVADALVQEGFVEPTDEDLELLLDPGNPNNVLDVLEKSPSAVQAEADEHERQRFIGVILAAAEPLRTNTGDREAARAKANARAAWIEKVKQSSVEDLRRIHEKQQLRSAEPVWLHEVVKTDDKQRQLAHGRFAPLTPTYVPPGKLEGVPWSSTLIKRLGVVAPQELRRLLRVFGPDQINAVLNGTVQ